MKTEERKARTALIPLITVDGCCGPIIQPPQKDTARQVQILAALADPTRLQIVELLAAQTEPLCVCEIVTHFALGQPTISHHLRVLREAALVTWEKRGLWVYYALNQPTLAQVTTYLGGLLPQAPTVAARSF
jgi:ArsR family transcriptional regulator